MSSIPNLYIPGFQKCATSSLFESLILHPEISEPSDWHDLDRSTYPKETHFFNQHYHRGIEFVESLYAGCTERYRLDGTPNYFAAENALGRIAKAAPDARFVVGMRNPVDRLISAWNHWNQLHPRGRWPIPRPEGTLEQNLKAEMDNAEKIGFGQGFLGMGCYAIHLERALRIIPRDRIHFVFAEHLGDNFEEEMKSIFRFLELPPLTLPLLHQHRRKWTVTRIRPRLRSFLKEFYFEKNSGLSALIGRTIPWEQ
ncbi:MAG: hypothetical protein CMO55_17230 [Verrucomicrobiales bacterium]|nr:hypothetical protein [Verrucomicrobiales bacterium]